ncbi:MAG: SAM-dependent methyltransferase [Sphingomonadales bacterium]
MSSLKEYLAQLITAEGPLPLDRYMEICLTDPEHGYYMTRDPFGRKGDFITAPEVSQMFGEIIAFWVIDCWHMMGAPQAFRLVELGPGRGSLMADVMRTLKIAPPVREAAGLHLVEASPALRKLQEEKLEGQWHERLEDVPEGPLIVIANEFFDALPVRQFQKTGSGWREVVVEAKKGVLFLGLAEPGEALERIGSELRATAEVGQIAEASPAALAVAQGLGERLARDGGGALLIDYGYGEDALGETLQAVKAHRFTGLLEEPGEADLTAHVNFAALARAFQEAGAKTSGPISQGDFLRRMGIELRAARLMAAAEPDQRAEISSALQRLISDQAMGAHFRVLAVTSEELGVPVGFEEAGLEGAGSESGSDA